MTMPVLGLDTSNYTTSAAVFDGADGCNAGRLLAVRPGELGLRQSDALFQHVKQPPALLEELEGRGLLRDLKAGGASTRPRAVEGSTCPASWRGSPREGRWPPPLGCRFCLLPPAGAPGGGGLVRRADGPAGRSLPGLAPVRRHHRAAAGPAPGDQCGGGEAGRDQRHLRWPAHRPHRRPAGAPVPGWQSAGRVLSSGGCLYGVPREAEGPHVLPVRDGESGEETAGGGRALANVARFTLDTVCSVVLRATQEAQRRCPGLPVLCSGGVASNRQLRAAMERELRRPVRPALLLHGQRHGGGHPDPTGPGGRGAGMREETILSPSQVSGYIKSWMDRDRLLSGLLVRGSCPTIRCIPPGTTILR